MAETLPRSVRSLDARARALVNDTGPLRSPSPWHIVGNLDAAAKAIAAFAQSEREAAAAAPMQHLRAVLYMLADLHPDYQCDALQQAMLFYNDASETKIEPSGIDQDHLLSGGNLQTRIEAAAAEARRAAIEECAQHFGKQAIEYEAAAAFHELAREKHGIAEEIRALASPTPQEETPDGHQK